MDSDIDVLMEQIPLGMFHYKLLLMCGLLFMCDSMEVSLLTFMNTCAGNEWGLTDVQRASISAVVFSGELFGGLFFGPLADRFGRKRAFLCACCLIVTFGLLSGASPSYEWLLVFRGIVGFGVGGLTVPFDLLAEFLPSAVRGKFLLYIEFFWTVGSLFVAGMAWMALEVRTTLPLCALVDTLQQYLLHPSHSLKNRRLDGGDWLTLLLCPLVYVPCYPCFTYQNHLDGCNTKVVIGKQKAFFDKQH